MQINKKTIFFENLDALRALAFLWVFIYHVFEYIPYKTSSAFEEIIIKGMVNKGYLGVNLFFVLSGFLITYLLLNEKEKTKSINIKNFYIRRILRIWPVYFLALLLGFIVYPLLIKQFTLETLKEHALYYVFFLNNFDRINSFFTGVGNDNLGVLWSIAVEEQFYLLWPLLLLFFKSRHFSYLFGSIILLSLTFRYIHHSSEPIIYLHTLSVISDLAIGALLAYSTFYKTRIFNWVTNCPKLLIALVYIVLLILVFYHKQWSKLSIFYIVTERTIFGLLFAFVIAEQCFANNSLFKLGRFKNLSRLGIISYGLYCFHLYSIVIIQKINVVFTLNIQSPLIFYSELFICLVISIITCYFSFKLFESKFLILKKRFSITGT